MQAPYRNKKLADKTTMDSADQQAPVTPPRRAQHQNGVGHAAILTLLLLAGLITLMWLSEDKVLRTFGIAALIGLGGVILHMTQRFARIAHRSLEQQQLRESLETYSTATTIQEVHDGTLRAAITMVHALDKEAVITLVVIGSHEWEVAFTSHPRGEGLRGMKRIDSVLELIFGYQHAPHQWNEHHDATLINQRFVLTFPVRLEEGQKATLVVDSKKQLSADNIDAIAALCQQMSLASNAIVQKAEDIELLMDARYRVLLQHAPDAVFVTDLLGHSLFANAMGENILRDVGNTQSLFEMIHPQDRPAFVSLVQNAPHSNNYADANLVECRVATTDNRIYWLELCALDMSDDEDIKGIVINTRDITQRKMLEHDLRHRILHDELTGIANLAYLKERSEFALSFRRSGNSVAAVLFIGLTNFAALISLLGKSSANDILKIVAFRLDNYVRGHDTAAYIDGDRFAVLLQDVRSESDIDTIVSRLIEVIQRPIEFDSRDISLNAAIGICMAQPDYTVDVFLRNAEVALNEARESDTRMAIFSGSMAVEAGERVKVRRDLAHAIENNELLMNYQPLIELESNRLCGFEALLRWVHPVRGTVNPGLFIPIAEESGLINQIGEWVLEQACTQLATWQRKYPNKVLQMHINVSNRQLEDRNIVDVVDSILRNTDVEPTSIILEMTESRNLYETHARAQLERLRSLGVGIATDEFGGTFNSYAVLQELPITTVKIDRSLILSLETNFQKANAQLRKLIEMAHAAGVLVVAEGIEDDRQCELLTSMGADRAQGYYFGRPVSADGVSSFLARKSDLVAAQ